MVDGVIQYSAAMIVRTVQCATIADGSGTDITIGLTRYDWGTSAGGDGDVSIRLSTTEQQSKRSHPTITDGSQPG